MLFFSLDWCVICLFFIQNTPKDFMNHGCYGDGNTSDTKILQGVGRYHPYINATGCLEFCLKEGYLLVGISYGCRICYCGELDTNYTMYGRKPDSSCEQNTECHVEPALRIYQGRHVVKWLKYKLVVREYNSMSMRIQHYEYRSTTIWEREYNSMSTRVHSISMRIQQYEYASTTIWEREHNIISKSKTVWVREHNIMRTRV